MKKIKFVSKKKINKIISHRKPLGLFYSKQNRVFIAVDNSTGDAFTEQFTNSLDCRQFLIGKIDVV